MAKYKVGDILRSPRKSRYWRGTGVVTKVYGDGIIDVKGDNGEGEMEIHEEDIMNSCVRSRNSVVANALNAAARNAMAKKQFGNVTAFTFGDGLYSGINVSFGPKIEGETPKEVIAKAKSFLAEFEKAVAGIKNAIAWMSAL